MNLNWVTGILVVIVILIGAYVFTRPSAVSGPQGPQGPQGQQGIPGQDGKDGQKGSNGSSGANGTSGQTFGSVTGPDSSFPCETHNGVTTCFDRQVFKTATTTICSIKSPSATSTLLQGSGVKFLTSSTTAPLVTIAKGASQGATTTLITSAIVAAGAASTVSASTTFSTFATIDGPTVFPPNNYLVVGLSGGVGTFSPTGNCSVRWQIN